MKVHTRNKKRNTCYFNENVFIIKLVKSIKNLLNLVGNSKCSFYISIAKTYPQILKLYAIKAVCLYSLTHANTSSSYIYVFYSQIVEIDTGDISGIGPESNLCGQIQRTVARIRGFGQGLQREKCPNYGLALILTNFVGLDKRFKLSTTAPYWGNSFCLACATHMDC